MKNRHRLTQKSPATKKLFLASIERYSQIKNHWSNIALILPWLKDINTFVFLVLNKEAQILLLWSLSYLSVCSHWLSVWSLCLILLSLVCLISFFCLSVWSLSFVCLSDLFLLSVCLSDPQINTTEKTLFEKIDSHTLLLKSCVMSSYFESTISDCCVASILYTLWV